MSALRIRSVGKG